jgi:hypothetical protein
MGIDSFALIFTHPVGGKNSSYDVFVYVYIVRLRQFAMEYYAFPIVFFLNAVVLNNGDWD